MTYVYVNDDSEILLIAYSDEEAEGKLGKLVKSPKEWIRDEREGEDNEEDF